MRNRPFYLVGLLLSMWMLSVSAENRPTPVSLIELIAHPEQYDKRLVSVRGFLVFYRPEHDIAYTMLYLHEEDARNRLDNGILIVSSGQMLHDREKLDREYVNLIGVFRAVPASPNAQDVVTELGDIQSCTFWSDPHRPIGEPNNANTKPRQ